MRRAHIRPGKTSNDFDGRPDTEVYSSQHHDEHGQSKKFALLKEKTVLAYDVEFTASSGIVIHSQCESEWWAWECWSEEFWESLDDLIVKENYFSE